MAELDIFPDTNIFLHYPPLAHIDWTKLTGADAVQIIVCREVIRELDAKKSDGQLSSRASRAIKEIRDAETTQQEIRPGVTVGIFAQSIRHSDFTGILSPDEGDDKIIHLVQQYQLQNPDRNVALVTEDYGMELQCKTAGVAVIRMDAGLRLDNPQDEVTKKLKQATQELTQLKNRQPKLSIVPSNRSSEQSNWPPEFVLNDAWKTDCSQRQLSEIEAHYPRDPRNFAIGRDEPQSLHRQMIRQSMLSTITQEQVREYAKERDEFIAKYRKYLESLSFYHSLRDQGISVTLTLLNEGTCLATDIDVTINWPASVFLVAPAGSVEAMPIEVPPKPPTPPDLPMTLATMAHAAARSNLIRDLPNLAGFHVQQRDDFAPKISSKNSEHESCTTHIRLGKLKHGHPICLGEFYVCFVSWEVCKSFSAKYSISAGELISPVDGQIPVIIKLKSSCG